MQKIKTNIAGPAGMLEAIICFEDSLETSRRIAVLCHPHPLHQGSMHNKVITTLERAYLNLGISTIRFNFRGVGESEGNYGEIEGEIDDATQVIQWALQKNKTASLCLAGFSFGSYIAAYCATQLPCEHLISVAPPVSNMPFSKLQPIDTPWLVVQGDKDEVVAQDQVSAWHNTHHNHNRQLMMISDCSHFFHGKLLELRSLVEKFIAAY